MLRRTVATNIRSRQTRLKNSAGPSDFNGRRNGPDGSSNRLAILVHCRRSQADHTVGLDLTSLEDHLAAIEVLSALVSRHVWAHCRVVEGISCTLRRVRRPIEPFGTPVASMELRDESIPTSAQPHISGISLFLAVWASYRGCLGRESFFCEAQLCEVQIVG